MVPHRRLLATSILCVLPLFSLTEVPAQKYVPDLPVVETDSDGRPPADALVLFDGSGNFGFTQPDGSAADWKVEDGVLIAGDHDIISKDWFRDAQVHVEFNLPGDDPSHGNSGLYFHDLYEVQILDSHNPNRFTAKQQCASLFNLYAPMVNVTRAPGEWQSYDILFRAARLDRRSGKVVKPAHFTILHNGVLVQYERTLREGTGRGRRNPMVSEGPLKLQAHGSPVRFRNIWIRRLPYQR